MDFSSLPDNVFLQICRYLPLRDQIRVGSVNVAFRRMSDIVISETKSLDLNDVALKNISPLGFSRLLNLCQDGLRQCNLSECVDKKYERCMAEVFNQYSYPQLNTLRFHFRYNSVIDISLRNNARNLQNLSVQYAINFPDVIMEWLETLDFCCTNRTIGRLVGKMPNLRHLNVRDKGFSYRMLDSFLGTVPLLESFCVRIEHYSRGARPLDLEGNGMAAFWQLKSLNRFEISYSFFYAAGQERVIIGSTALMRIAKSFPRLSVLSLCHVSSGKKGVAALSALKQLREVQLDKVQGNIDVGLRELSKCEYLEKLVVVDTQYIGLIGSSDHYFSYISAVTAAALLQSCPRLSVIACGQLAGIDTREDAVAFISSLAGLEKRVISLRFHKHEPHTQGIWTSQEVIDTAKKLDEAAGLVLQISGRSKPTSYAN